MCSSSSVVLVKRGVAFDSLCGLMHQPVWMNVCDKFAAMLDNDGRTSDPHAVTMERNAIIDVHHHHENFEVQGYSHDDDDKNLAVLAACRLCFPRYLPAIDSGNGIGEKEVVFMLQKIDEENLGALLTHIEGVPLLKMISAKSSVECDADRRKVTVTIGQDGHEDHITATFPVGERAWRGHRKLCF